MVRKKYVSMVTFPKARVLDDLLFYCFKNSAYTNVSDRLHTPMTYEYIATTAKIYGDFECIPGQEAKIQFHDPYVSNSIIKYFFLFLFI